jgi:hypothetical protein
MLREQSRMKEGVLAIQVADLRLFAPLRPCQGKTHPGCRKDE